MKKVICLVLVLCGFLTGGIAQAQTGFKVKTKIKNPHKYTMYLAYTSDEQMVLDTNYVMENGWAVFNGTVNGPVVASLGVRRNPKLQIVSGPGVIPGPSLSFFLTNETIEIKGDVDQIYRAKVKGGQANQEWSAIKAKQAKLTHQNWVELKRTYENFDPEKDEVIYKKLGDLRTKNSQKESDLVDAFIGKYPNSLVSVYFLAGKVNELSLAELKSAYAKLGNEHKNSVYAKRITEKIENMDATAIGKIALPINKKDLDGKLFDLASLKGKYVLLDFWGSWCGPCRGSHPHLKELYAKYKGQGFEIVGIAQESGDLDRAKSAWLKAIEEDDIRWIHVLNNDGVEQYDVVKAYGVSAFPTKILLDKDGKIVARYIGSDGAFDEKLKEIFGN